MTDTERIEAALQQVQKVFKLTYSIVDEPGKTTYAKVKVFTKREFDVAQVQHIARLIDPDITWIKVHRAKIAEQGLRGFDAEQGKMVDQTEANHLHFGKEVELECFVS